MDLKKVVFRVLQVLFLAIGAVLVGVSLWQSHQARQTLNWPAAEGTITDAKVKRHVSSQTTQDRHFKHEESHDVSYIPKIAYTYRVDGQEYSNNKIRFSSVSKETRAEAQKFLKQFTDRTTVDVYYNPDKPGRSVLLQGGKNQLWIIGVVFLGIGLLVILIYWLVRNR